MSNDFENALGSIETTCSTSNGRSQIFHPGSHGYLNGIRHYFDSSSQNAHLSVEPGSVEDLSDIMKAISNGKVPFAVKSGGHTSNPGFSSTNGVHISMSRFNKISHDRATQELTVGAACLFDEIYKFIRPKGHNIVGGGGSVGLSGIDNLVKVQLVLPDGQVVTATKDTRSDLFWALKGGGNNFGIATEYTLKTHSQGPVYGGLLAFGKARVERVKDAIINFINKKNAQAAIVAAFRCYRNHGVHEFKFTILAFYDGAKPSDDPFQDFLDIPHQGQLTTQSYARMDEAMTYLYDHAPMDFVTMNLFDLRPDETVTASLLANQFRSDETATAQLVGNQGGSKGPISPPTVGMGVMNARARWGNVMVSNYTRKLIDVVEEEAKAARQLMEKHKGKMVVVDIWPFLPTMFDKSVDSAWPHKKEEPNGPLLMYILWEGEENDKVWIDQMKIALEHIHRVALKEGCTKADAPVYCNTTLKEITSVDQIYREHRNDLSLLRAAYDPNKVMNLTGGFRIPHRFLGGSYTVTNVKNGLVGVSGDSVVKVDNMQQAVFSISRAGQDEYIISKESHGTTTEQDNHVRIVAEVRTRWKIIPKRRRENQLEFSIIKAESTTDECWVLKDNNTGTQVLCEAGTDDTTLWRLQKVNPA